MDIYFHSDLLPWEKAPFLSLLEALEKEIPIRAVEVNAGMRGTISKSKAESHWIIARNWREAVGFLGKPPKKDTPVYVSVMDVSSPRENIYKVLMSHFTGSIPNSVTLIVHSPLNYRFFTELQKVGTEKVRYLPLPFQTQPTIVRVQSNPIKVGVFGHFNSDGNLNFLMNVAHYCLKKNAQMEFYFLGTGPHYAHLSQMVRELGLESLVSIVETKDEDQMKEIDIAMYSPLRNDHFLPIYFAARQGIPVICSEVQGLDEIVTDTHTGFVMPINETKPFGEVVIRLASDSQLRTSIGLKLRESLSQKFGVSSLLELYLSVFQSKSMGQKSLGKAA